MYSKLFVEWGKRIVYNNRRMRPVGSQDLYQVQAMSIVSDFDIDVLTNLYLPLIGASAFAIYVAFVRKSRKQSPMVEETHAPLMARLQLTTGQFRKGVEALEAVGLVKSYIKKNGQPGFLYALYAPKDPSSFFNDPLLLGTLRRYIGEEETERIHAQYQLIGNLEGYEDVSCGFSEFFHPDFNDPVYSQQGFAAVGHHSGRIATDFDYSSFAAGLQELGFQQKLLGKRELVLIERYASLYGIEGKEMAIIIAKCIDMGKPINHRVDFAAVEKQCATSIRFIAQSMRKSSPSNVSSSTPLASKIKMMDEVTPIQFLTFLQGMKKPAKADIKIVNTLATEIGLSNAAINALIDYVLQTNNNVLSSAYCEKLGAFLVREGVETSRDAMDKLMSTKKKTGKPAVYAGASAPLPPQSNVEEPTSEEEEFNELLSELYGGQQ